MTLIIGIGHKARQGKDTVANYWHSLLPQHMKLYSFADELKLYCKTHHAELEWKWQLAHQTKQKPGWKDDPIYGCTSILQWYGTEVVRRQNPNHWVEQVDEHINQDRPHIAVIRDVRFPNEAEYVKQNAGILVDVRRYTVDGDLYVDPGRDPKHESEVALDGYSGWDYYLEAPSGYTEELRHDALLVLKAIFQTKGMDFQDYSFLLPDCIYCNSLESRTHGTKDAIAQADGCGE